MIVPMAACFVNAYCIMCAAGLFILHDGFCTAEAAPQTAPFAKGSRGKDWCESINASAVGSWRQAHKQASGAVARADGGEGMSDLFDYPRTAGFKKAGTSSKAAREIEPRAKTLRERVLDAFKSQGDMTADECASYLGESILSIRPRVSELAARFLIVETAARRTNDSGMSAQVWRAV